MADDKQMTPEEAAETWAEQTVLEHGDQIFQNDRGMMKTVLKHICLMNQPITNLTTTIVRNNKIYEVRVGGMTLIDHHSLGLSFLAKQKPHAHLCQYLTSYTQYDLESRIMTVCFTFACLEMKKPDVSGLSKRPAARHRVSKMTD